MRTALASACAALLAAVAGAQPPALETLKADGTRKINVPRMAVLDTMGAVIVVEIEGDKVEK